ncbi:lipopolysaccharide heptosyltransferase II [Niveibacterium sp. 24ML]|uniref:lipopolysaccharide heptosyltransferase II n=1 Tax=Niveibacterium sp. 24ML TaxID=2985512 RepID=UPI00226E9A69|nr:lipopolysaccharide heptosyltransferase II [Niveibacterium sp. 24ML]MCX9155227.1 lipopolysaccharide heptosyltransferase II [Niveibacterium sp. 24ML]
MTRILIVTPNWIGDCVAAQPLLMRLATRRPGVVIDALAPAWVAPAMQAMPQIRKVISNPFGHGAFEPVGRWKLARSLAGEYDEAYVLPNSWKSALIPFFAGIKVRVGFIGEARYGVINRAHKLDKQALPLQVERYAQLAEAAGATLERPLPNPALLRTPAQIAATLAKYELATASTPVVFCPGAEYGPAKRWPERHYAELARRLAADGTPVWILGSKKDVPVAEEIVRLSNGAARDLCGRTSLGEAIDLLAHARFAVTNDSGLMHVAAALGTPLVAVFGSSSPNYTPPLSDRAAVVWLKLACSPCFKRECPLGHLDCLNKISPEQVEAQARALLADGVSA